LRHLSHRLLPYSPYFYFSLAPAPPSFSTLSLHDALPISHLLPAGAVAVLLRHRFCLPLRADRQRIGRGGHWPGARCRFPGLHLQDRKSTRLNSSHVSISYAVFCLKKKKKKEETTKNQHRQ